MPSAHCVSTVHGVILDADQGFLDLVRRTLPETVGASYATITDPRDLPKSAAMLTALVPNAAPVRLQKRYVRPDGTSVSANILVTRFTDPDRLVSTLYWNETGRTLPPARLWAAALHVRHVLAVRRSAFGGELFADGLEHMLIEIYLAEAEGRTISVGELLEKVALAPSVAKRWMLVLRDRGLLHSTETERLDLYLTQAGLEKMEKILSAVVHPLAGALDSS
jgi:hypothetical protein